MHLNVHSSTYNSQDMQATQSGKMSVVAQSCLTVCDPMDHNLPGSSVQGIFRQEYWSGLPFPSQGIFTTQLLNPLLLHLLSLLHRNVNSLPLCHLGNPDMHLLLFICHVTLNHLSIPSCKRS